MTSLKEVDPNDLDNIGSQISSFVHTANSLFELERNSILGLQDDFKQQASGLSADEVKHLRDDYRNARKDLRNNYDDLKKQYQEIFSNFRHDVKHAVKNLPSVTLSDRENIQLLEKTRMHIDRLEDDSDKEYESDMMKVFVREQAEQKKQLDELRLKIYIEEDKGSRGSDEKLQEWKELEDEIKDSLKELKDQVKDTEKQTKKENKISENTFKEFIKDLEKDLKKIEKENEDKDKPDNSGKGSSNSGKGNSNSEKNYEDKDKPDNSGKGSSNSGKGNSNSGKGSSNSGKGNGKD